MFWKSLLSIPQCFFLPAVVGERLEPSATHTVTVYSKKMSRTGLEQGLIMNVQWQHIFKISITVEIGLWHWLPFPHSHFQLFITLWSTTTHYFNGLNSRLLGTDVPSEITETFVSVLHGMGSTVMLQDHISSQIISFAMKVTIKIP
jgi:hypothetical protein